MSFRSYGDESMDGSDQRDLIYETELENNLVRYRNEGETIASQNGWNPDFIDAPFPNEWEEFIPRSDGEILVGWHGNKIETAIIYTQAFLNYRRVKTALAEYHCYVYPRHTGVCQNLAGGNYDINIPERVLVGLKNKLQENRAGSVQGIQLPGIPQVYAEEDPSINSGVNGNEQESQIINYPQSANVRIVISNISMFSTSIPINDIGQLQALSNASNEWRYTLIGSSTNQPLMTLSGLINKINSMIASVVTPQEPEEEVTTVEVEPPGVAVTQCYMVHGKKLPLTQQAVDYYRNIGVTVTPCEVITSPPPPPPPTPTPTPILTEPGQVNWIPEPFFSFINNVFRR